MTDTAQTQRLESSLSRYPSLHPFSVSHDRGKTARKVCTGLTRLW